MTTDRTGEVRHAAERIVAAYGHHRRDEYFGLFAPEASFVFYTAESRLESRAEYEVLWDSWERDSGFRVLQCESTNQRIDIVGDVAVFVHDVATRLRMDGAEESLRERETIVLAWRGNQWVAIHEHLSPQP